MTEVASVRVVDALVREGSLTAPELASAVGVTRGFLYNVAAVLKLEGVVEARKRVVDGRVQVFYVLTRRWLCD